MALDRVAQPGLRRKWFRPLMVLAGVCLVLGIAAAWYWWPRPLTSAETAIVGTWISPRQPNGSRTVLDLKPDRTCRIRWLDGSGNEISASPPRDGQWRVEGGSLVVEMRRYAGALPPLEGLKAGRYWKSWTFAIEGDGLVLNPPGGTPITLQRSPGAHPPETSQPGGSESGADR